MWTVVGYIKATMTAPSHITPHCLSTCSHYYYFKDLDLELYSTEYIQPSTCQQSSRLSLCPQYPLTILTERMNCKKLTENSSLIKHQWLNEQSTTLTTKHYFSRYCHQQVNGGLGLLWYSWYGHAVSLNPTLKLIQIRDLYYHIRKKSACHCVSLQLKN